MSSYISPKVKKRISRLGGCGVFAIGKIKKDELITDFINGPGKYINIKEADKLFDSGWDYMLQVDDDTYFAATTEDELEDTDFINHSCNPNCGIKGKIKIVAMRNIEHGEEITFDYAMSESSKYEFNCECGQSNCRKVITGDDWKKLDLQKKYKGYFSDYLQKKMVKE